MVKYNLIKIYTFGYKLQYSIKFKSEFLIEIGNKMSIELKYLINFRPSWNWENNDKLFYN